MKFKELNPSVVELASANIFYRVQSVRARSSNVVINGVSLPPVGLMSSRFCLCDEPVAYLADRQETALYDSLLRRDADNLAEFERIPALELENWVVDCQYKV